MQTTIDRVVFQTANVRVGAFRCGLLHPCFRDSGPTESHIVVFPRTAVWICHAGSAAFLADPGVVTIYNRGQEYTRAAAACDGDRSDWFGVSPDVATAITQEYDPSAADRPARPFRAQWAPADLALYLRQRWVFTRLERGSIDPLEAEESVFDIVSEIVRRAHGAEQQPARRVSDAHRDLAQRARAELARDIGAHTDVTQLAARVGVSPFHLCRVFRAVTGQTLHAYRLDLRCRKALERLAVRGADISRVALELGFSSHSHFTAALRQRMGVTPSQLRRSLAR